MTIKPFEFPRFEKAKHDISTNLRIADYMAYVSVTDHIEIEICATAEYEAETIFEKISPRIDDIGENEAKAWYDKTIKESNEFWESYITKSYISEEMFKELMNNRTEDLVTHDEKVIKETATKIFRRIETKMKQMHYKTDTYRFASLNGEILRLEKEFGFEKEEE